MKSFGAICYLKKLVLVGGKKSTFVFLYIGIFFINILLMFFLVQTDPLLKFICLIFILFCTDALWRSYFFSIFLSEAINHSKPAQNSTRQLSVFVNKIVQW